MASPPCLNKTTSGGVMRTKQAFTLIELLIVVAIIGILAAIAVPNFLNAQIKAKYARCLSDMRGCQTALEMYALDHGGKIPPNGFDGSENAWGLSRVLTTPMAYIAEIPKDPFFKTKREASEDFYEQYCDPRGEGKYFYQAGDNVYRSNMADPRRPGAWRYCLQGRGADTDLSSKNNGFALEVDWPYTYGYDPSNGVVSDGNVAFPR
ncbi:MAG: prepilin-type N-terminal cleavage/methylation domain-containing protein [bacterium]|nr:prepilin-type N-terminal cleavage/methylation domain-containing protein [bacterium]